jgi:hypothetical protein
MQLIMKIMTKQLSITPESTFVVMLGMVSKRWYCLLCGDATAVIHHSRIHLCSDARNGVQEMILPVMWRCWAVAPSPGLHSLSLSLSLSHTHTHCRLLTLPTSKQDPWKCVCALHHSKGCGREWRQTWGWSCWEEICANYETMFVILEWKILLTTIGVFAC